MVLTAIQRKEILDTLRKYMFVDIQTAINGKANYLAALGLSTYTENLGGFLQGDLENNLGSNYIAFIQGYFPTTYTSLNTTLLNSPIKAGLYKIVRSGLVHEYFMKAQSSVNIAGSAIPSCGIEYNPSGNPQLVFYADVYFEDFKIAFNKSYNDIMVSTTLPNNLQISFDKAFENLPFPPINRMASTSGSGISSSGTINPSSS